MKQGLDKFKADLHLHTCLSPCGDWRMSPKAVVEQSLRKGMDMIAICDHNSAENAGAAIRVGKRLGIRVLPGMEICSKEEVHLVALFENLDQALRMQALIYAHLPGENNEVVWGPQIVANEKDEVLAENQRLLIGATTLGIHALALRVHSLGGIAIAAHVDRPAFGILRQLGFIPPDLALDAVEVSYRIPLARAGEQIRGIAPWACVTSSDAHFFEDIGRVHTGFTMAEPSLSELRMAIWGEHGRRIEV